MEKNSFATNVCDECLRRMFAFIYRRYCRRKLRRLSREVHQYGNYIAYSYIYATMLSFVCLLQYGESSNRFLVPTCNKNNWL